MRSLRLSCSFFALAFVFAPQYAKAQDDPNFEIGLKPYGSYHMGNIDTVNLGNGSLGVDIPLISYPQRGGKLTLDFSLHYFNASSTKTEYCYSGDCIWVPSGNSGYFAVIDQQSLNLTDGPCTVVNSSNGEEYCNYKIVASDGADHLYAPTNSSSSAYRSLDATGISNVSIDSQGISHSNMSYAYPDSREDANGNEITYSISAGTWTDTMGRTIPAQIQSTNQSNFTGCTGVQPIAYVELWTPPGVASANGGNSSGTYPLKVCYSTIASGATLITSVVLPNGTAWTFAWIQSSNSNITGFDVSQVTLPTGGTISYTWASGQICGSSSPYAQTDIVLTRTLNPNDGVTPASQWTYGYSGGYSGGVTAVTDPAGNASVHTFGVAGPSGTANSCYLYENQAEYYQGSSTSGTLLKTVNTKYSYAIWNPPGFYPIDPPAINVVPIEVDTIWSNGQQATVKNTYDSGFTVYYPFYNSNGTLISNDGTQSALYGKELTKQEYDYGTNGLGNLLRTTTTSYLALNNSTYLGYNLLDLPSSVQIKDGGGTQRAYTTYSYDQYTLGTSGITTQHVTPPNGTYRGNPTSTSRWLSGSTTATTHCNIAVSNGYLTDYKTYNDTGTVATAVDSCGASYTDTNHKTSYTYSGTYIGGLLTTVANPLSQSTNYAYDFNTGFLTSSQDPNGRTISHTPDLMTRTIETDYPDSGQTKYCYTDLGGSTCSQSGPPYDVAVTEKISSGVSMTSTLLIDGLGRLQQTQLNSDPEGVTYTQTQYDVMERKYKVWNPTRCSMPTTNCGESSWGYTTTLYDALNRPTSVTKQDGSVVTTAYCGSTTLVTDEVGHWRRSTTDALGRLIEVDEPNSTSATVNSNGCRGTGEPIWVTTYTYDALDDLIGVTQSTSRQRTFAFDSLKRLTSSLNPETGTTAITYAYDADGNVITKNDARGLTITYSYDVLDRMTSRTYSNGDPAASYAYDQPTCVSQTPCYNIGWRTSMTDAGGSESISYDPMGREWGEQRTTNGVTKATSYSYNYDGSLAALTYPSGRVITYTPNAAGRPGIAQDVANGITYVSGSCPNGGACYTPSGELAQMQNGANLVSTYIYNSRVQPCWIYATTATALPWQPTTTNCISTATAGTILDLKYNFGLGAGDNGNVIGITNNRDTTRTQSFSYDQVNRIITAQTSATTGANCWGELYALDQWANLTTIGVLAGYTGCTQDTLSISVGTNNQLVATGYSYDASGNMLSDAANNYAWNAESEIKSAAGVNYTYDGDGNRLQKSSGKIYWYGAGTEILDESDASGNFTNEYVFVGGKRIAMRNISTGSIYYYAEDMLGSSRTIVQAGQTSPCYDADFPPFGSERVVTNSCSQNYKFEGKERDTETGNDDFGARYYSSRIGRWLSSDWSAVPAPVPYANLNNPQTLNLYAMVSDNPETFADLDGHCQDGQLTTSGGGCLSGVAAAAWFVANPWLSVNNNSNASPQQQSQQAQNQPASGEGSQANLDRRAAIAAAAQAHEGDKSMPYTEDHATCNLFCQKAVGESGAPKPEVPKADGRMGAPSAAELAGDRVPPGWRILKKGESPQPGDIAARKEHFVDATGHSGIVVSVSRGVVTVMAAHQTVIGKDMSFQPGSAQYHNVFLRYTGD